MARTDDRRQLRAARGVERRARRTRIRQVRASHGTTALCGVAKRAQVESKRSQAPARCVQPDSEAGVELLRMPSIADWPTADCAGTKRVAQASSVASEIVNRALRVASLLSVCFPRPDARGEPLGPAARGCEVFDRRVLRKANTPSKGPRPDWSAIFSLSRRSEAPHVRYHARCGSSGSALNPRDPTPEAAWQPART